MGWPLVFRKNCPCMTLLTQSIPLVIWLLFLHGILNIWYRPFLRVWYFSLFNHSLYAAAILISRFSGQNCVFLKSLFLWEPTLNDAKAFDFFTRVELSRHCTRCLRAVGPSGSNGRCADRESNPGPPVLQTNFLPPSRGEAWRGFCYPDTSFGHLTSCDTWIPGDDAVTIWIRATCHTID